MRKLEEEDETQQNDTKVTEPVLFQQNVMAGEFDKINGLNTEEKEHTREDKKIEALVAELVSDMINSVWREIKMKMLTDGVAVVDKKPKVYPCDQCGVMFAQFASAVKHCKLKLKIKSATCPICKKNILVKKNLNRHIRNVHSNPKQKKTNVSVPTCEQCEQQFSSKHKLVEHMRRTHAAACKEGVLLQCKECDFSNISESRMKAHSTLVHSEPKEFKCTLCPLSLKSKCGIYKHINKVHTPDKQLEKPKLFIARKSLPAVVHDESMSVRQNSFVGQKPNGLQNSKQAPTVVQNLIISTKNDLIALDHTLQPSLGEQSSSPAQNCLVSTFIGHNSVQQHGELAQSSVQQHDELGQHSVHQHGEVGQNTVQQHDELGQNSIQQHGELGRNSVQQHGEVGQNSLHSNSNPSTSVIKSTSQLLPDNLLDISLDSFMDISFENVPQNMFDLKL